MTSLKNTSIFRTIHNRENPYVQLNKKTLWDEQLSLDAVGLWARCMSRPDNWAFNVKELVGKCKEGRCTIDRCIKELIENGYAARFEGFKQGSDGRMQGKVYQYVFFEFKATVEEIEREYEKFKKFLRDSDLHNFGARIVGDPHLLNTDSNNKRKTTPLPPKGRMDGFPKKSTSIKEILNGIDLSEKEKKRLSVFSEERLRHAIAYSKAVPAKGELIAQLWWAAENMPEIPKNPGMLKAENKQRALEVKRKAKIPANVIFEVLSKAVEIGYTDAQSAPEVIEYTDKKFQEKLNECIKKFKIKT